MCKLCAMTRGTAVEVNDFFPAGTYRRNLGGYADVGACGPLAGSHAPKVLYSRGQAVY